MWRVTLANAPQAKSEANVESSSTTNKEIFVQIRHNSEVTALLPLGVEHDFEIYEAGRAEGYVSIDEPVTPPCIAIDGKCISGLRRGSQCSALRKQFG